MNQIICCISALVIYNISFAQAFYLLGPCLFSYLLLIFWLYLFISRFSLRICRLAKTPTDKIFSKSATVFLLLVVKEHKKAPAGHSNRIYCPTDACRFLYIRKDLLSHLKVTRPFRYILTGACSVCTVAICSAKSSFL